MSENQVQEAGFGRWPLKFISLPPSIRTVLHLPSENDPPPFNPDDFRGPGIEQDNRTYTHAQAVAAADSLAAVQNILTGIAVPDETNPVPQAQDRTRLRDLLNVFVPLLSGVTEGGAWNYGLQNDLRNALANVQNHFPAPGWQHVIHNLERAGDLIFEFINML